MFPFTIFDNEYIKLLCTSPFLLFSTLSLVYVFAKEFHKLYAARDEEDLLSPSAPIERSPMPTRENDLELGEDDVSNKRNEELKRQVAAALRERGDDKSKKKPCPNCGAPKLITDETCPYCGQ